jgi:transposase
MAEAAKDSLPWHFYEEALNRTERRVTPEVMRVRRQTVEHPFATIKYRILGHPGLLVRRLTGPRTEIAIGTMKYDLKRITKVLGGATLTAQLQSR